MRAFHRAACALAFALVGGAAHAANVPQEMVDANTSFCLQIAKSPSGTRIDPQMPTDPAKAPAYCACVSKAYWGRVPQVDFDGMLAEHQQMAAAAQSGAPPKQGPHGKAITDALHARMGEARKSCH